MENTLSFVSIKGFPAACLDNLCTPLRKMKLLSFARSDQHEWFKVWSLALLATYPPCKHTSYSLCGHDCLSSDFLTFWLLWFRSGCTYQNAPTKLTMAISCENASLAGPRSYTRNSQELCISLFLYILYICLMKKFPTTTQILVGFFQISTGQGCVAKIKINTLADFLFHRWILNLTLFIQNHHFGFSAILLWGYLPCVGAATQVNWSLKLKHNFNNAQKYVIMFFQALLKSLISFDWVGSAYWVVQLGGFGKATLKAYSLFPYSVVQASFSVGSSRCSSCTSFQHGFGMTSLPRQSTYVFVWKIHLSPSPKPNVGQCFEGPLTWLNNEYIGCIIWVRAGLYFSNKNLPRLGAAGVTAYPGSTGRTGWHRCEALTLPSGSLAFLVISFLLLGIYCSSWAESSNFPISFYSKRHAHAICILYLRCLYIYISKSSNAF